jgi:FkbM family methyltransferase
MNPIKLWLRRFNINVSRFDQAESISLYEQDINRVMSAPTDMAIQVAQVLGKSKAQLKQDIFALSELGFKRNGYFVEFGATNGVTLSNTYLLSKEFGWTGILAEPAHCWHEALRSNRDCHIETACVWKETGKTLTFNEVDEGELSTIHQYSSLDYFKANRKRGHTYDVKTISLNDLLAKYNAPKVIDYLSIDTEGSELAILSALNFDRYQFRVITCEHGFRPIRSKLYDLLTSHGYVRKYIGLSRWDDWYVKAG